ncbi:hypothetical protein F4604DRAFT_1764118 [Suillus subluteus]|nr:hypothetical protein F4604DRAFT_1764118 [Suillus subluteus]
MRYRAMDRVLDELKHGHTSREKTHACSRVPFLATTYSTDVGATIVLYMGDGGGAFLLIHIRFKEASSIKPNHTHPSCHGGCTLWYAGMEESHSKFCTCTCVPAAILWRGECQWYYTSIQVVIVRGKPRLTVTVAVQSLIRSDTLETVPRQAWCLRSDVSV